MQYIRLLCLLLCVSLSAMAADSLVPGPASGTNASLLFVQQANGGRLVPRDNGTYKLVLRGIDVNLDTFTDRPERKAGQESVADFVAHWSSRGFTNDPPNAALLIEGAPTASDVVLLTINNPKFDPAKHTLTYDATALQGKVRGKLERLVQKANPVRKLRFAKASLFIDDGTLSSSPVYQPITLTISNAVPGQQIAISVTPNGTPIAWSTGPSFQAVSGIQVVAQSGTLPISQLNVNSGQITIWTTPSGGGGGGSLTFSVILYLVANAEIETFYLMSASPPGVQVAATIGNEIPLLVNQTETLFSWDH